MLEIDLHVPVGLDTGSVARAVEHACRNHGLVCTQTGSLAGYPSSVHWHFKKGSQKGTLEITWWERGHRLWFKIAANRTGEWMKSGTPALKDEIERYLASKPAGPAGID